MEQSIPSRRQFLAAVGNLASAGWLALNWPQIAAAAEPAHMDHMAMGGDAPVALAKSLTAAEAAEVEAIANQIVPGGSTPGARDAGVIMFIDNALGSFFAGQAPAFRKGISEFSAGWLAHTGATVPFSKASDADQVAWLRQVDQTAFFSAVRRLTILGLIALPKYGGNKDMLGWKLMNVEDNHVWAPPFGYYDVDYPGFQPYPGTKPYTA